MLGERQRGGRRKKNQKKTERKKKGKTTEKGRLLLFIMPNLFSHWHPPDVALDQKINIKTLEGTKQAVYEMDFLMSLKHFKKAGGKEGAGDALIGTGNEFHYPAELSSGLRLNSSIGISVRTKDLFLQSIIWNNSAKGGKP